MYKWDLWAVHQLHPLNSLKAPESNAPVMRLLKQAKSCYRCEIIPILSIILMLSLDFSQVSIVLPPYSIDFYPHKTELLYFFLPPYILLNIMHTCPSRYELEQGQRLLTSYWPE